ncbi:MAG: hypothetical protein ABH852_02305 [Methanobacteriota archaeon]
MGALNYLAMVVLAVIFVGLGFTLYSEYQRGAAEREFITKAELLAERVNAMSAQGEGSTDYLEIYVPPNCELSFSDSVISVRIGSSTNNIVVDIPINGPVFSDQRLNLKIQRTENGVDVSAT